MYEWKEAGLSNGANIVFTVTARYVKVISFGAKCTNILIVVDAYRILGRENIHIFCDDRSYTRISRKRCDTFDRAQLLLIDVICT